MPIVVINHNLLPNKKNCPLFLTEKLCNTKSGLYTRQSHRAQLGGFESDWNIEQFYK